MVEKKENLSNMTLVIIESPFAGDIEKNINYARACVRDSLSRGEAPLASHLLYTQEGILRDEVPEERNWGIEAGLAWGKKATKTIVYTDLGISGGMEKGIKRAEDEGREIEYRELENSDYMNDKESVKNDSPIIEIVVPQCLKVEARLVRGDTKSKVISEITNSDNNIILTTMLDKGARVFVTDSGKHLIVHTEESLAYNKEIIQSVWYQSLYADS